MADEPCGLINYQQVAVFVNDATLFRRGQQP
jgi:hypothetical protein